MGIYVCMEPYQLALICIDMMQFKGNEANYVLSGILVVVIFLIIIKELGYKRSSKFSWNLAVLPTPGLTSKVFSFNAYFQKDNLNTNFEHFPESDDEWEVISSHREFYASHHNETLKFYPNYVKIEWLSLEERIYWVADIKLPEGYQNNLIGVPFIIAQLHPKGLVTIFSGDKDNMSEICKSQAKPNGKESDIFQYCELPVNTQLDIALKRFKWVPKLSDNRKNKTKQYILTDINNYLPIYYYDEQIKQIPEGVSLNDTSVYPTDLINIGFDAEALLAGFEKLHQRDSTGQFILHVILQNNQLIDVEIMDVLGKIKIAIPAKFD